MVDNNWAVAETGGLILRVVVRRPRLAMVVGALLVLDREIIMMPVDVFYI